MSNKAVQLTHSERIRQLTDAVAVLCVIIQDDGKIVTSVDIEGATARDIYDGIEFLLKTLREEGVHNGNRSTPSAN